MQAAMATAKITPITMHVMAVPLSFAGCVSCPSGCACCTWS
jgi:hypothetical protein